MNLLHIHSMVCWKNQNSAPPPSKKEHISHPFVLLPNGIRNTNFRSPFVHPNHSANIFLFAPTELSTKKSLRDTLVFDDNILPYPLYHLILLVTFRNLHLSFFPK